MVGQNLLDGALVLSLKSSEVSGTFMTYDELRLGQKVKGTIATVSEKGIKVQLAHGVKGLMPLLHGGDMPLAYANVQKKFQVGAALSCRVRTHTHTRKCMHLRAIALIFSVARRAHFRREDRWNLTIAISFTDLGSCRSFTSTRRSAR